MQDTALLEIADLLLEARRLVRDDHPAAMRLALDVTLFQVGLCISGAPDGIDRSTGAAAAPISVRSAQAGQRSC